MDPDSVGSEIRIELDQNSVESVDYHYYFKKIIISSSIHLIVDCLGMADLKAVSDAKGGSVYRDHLPLLGEAGWYSVLLSSWSLV